MLGFLKSTQVSHQGDDFNLRAEERIGNMFFFFHKAMELEKEHHQTFSLLAKVLDEESVAELNEIKERAEDCMRQMRSNREDLEEMLRDKTIAANLKDKDSIKKLPEATLITHASISDVAKGWLFAYPSGSRDEIAQRIDVAANKWPVIPASDNRRSRHMHAMANLSQEQSEPQKGIWKIGENHVAQIEELFAGEKNTILSTVICFLRLIFRKYLNIYLRRRKRETNNLASITRDLCERDTRLHPETIDLRRLGVAKVASRACEMTKLLRP